MLGAALAARGVAPDVVVAGEMKRHAQTAAGVLEGAGWSRDVEVDAGWNEFDHLQVLAVHDQPTTVEGESEKAAFQRSFPGWITWKNRSCSLATLLLRRRFRCQASRL